MLAFTDCHLHLPVPTSSLSLSPSFSSKLKTQERAHVADHICTLYVSYFVTHVKDAFTAVFRPDALAKSLGISLLDFMKLTSKDSGLQLVQITAQSHLLDECRLTLTDEDVTSELQSGSAGTERMERISFQEGSPLKFKTSITGQTVADDMDSDDDQEADRRVTEVALGDGKRGVYARPGMESISIQNEDSNDSAMSGSSDRRDESADASVSEERLARQNGGRKGGKEDEEDRQGSVQAKEGASTAGETTAGEQTTKEDVPAAEKSPQLL